MTPNIFEVKKERKKERKKTASECEKMKEIVYTFVMMESLKHAKMPRKENLFFFFFFFFLKKKLHVPHKIGSVFPRGALKLERSKPTVSPATDIHRICFGTL